MVMISRKWVLMFLLLFLLFAVASCKEKPDVTSVPSEATTAIASISATETKSPSETTSPAAETAVMIPTVPPEIVFELSEDRSSVLGDRLRIETGDSALYFVGGKRKPVRIDYISEEYYYEYQDFFEECSLDGSSSALLVETNPYGSGRLIYSDGRTAVSIASDVDTYHLSADGTAVLFLVTPKYEHGVGGDLYHYDCVTGESKMIASGAGRLFSLSPDGDTVAYTTFYKMNYPDALTCYVGKIGEEATVLDTDSYCIAISDHAETIYYAKKEGARESLNVVYNGISKELFDSYAPSDRSWCEFDYYFYFNRDMTQIVFNSDGAAYFSMRGSDPVRISDETIYLGWTGNQYNPSYRVHKFSDNARTSFQTLNTGTKNLCNFVFATASRELMYFNSYNYLFNNEYVIFDENMHSSVLSLSDYLALDFPYTKKIPLSVCSKRTDDDTVFYLPGEAQYYEFDYSIYCDLYVLHNNGDAELVASSVNSIYLLEKEGPDILYYLAAPEGYEETVGDYYVQPLLNLYAVKETPGAEPILVTKDVYFVDSGDFGVVYWKFKRAGDDDDYVSYGLYTGAYVGVYHSKDGVSYTYVTERYYTQYYGG